ncbi:MAG: CDP-diacylglycerol--glycerol-3-phosphate 3-phosphatidyltransferase [Clostridia bacterium]|nr:CDP-diacylglycerol--glycerol-3-phosphate 3-phosphatidyltransferase [Clostridia bacterium]
MNLPNRLTIIRICLIPVCVFLQSADLYPWALGVFCLACLTDFLDGYLARKNDQVTVFGKFLDPVADKLLVLCAMIVLTSQGCLAAWCVCVVAARELAVDGLRLVAAGKNMVVSARMAGKIKTALQMFCVILCMLSAFVSVDPVFVTVSSVLMAAATVYSGFLYFRDLRSVFAG